MQNRDENKGVCKAMNNNPYQPQPQQPQSQQPQPQQMPVYQQPYVPQMQPQAPKPKLLDREMVGILGCALSAIGLTLAVVSAIVGGNATYVYGLIMVIVSLIFSVSGLVISFITANKNVKEGKSRGAFASWGMILGLTGVVLFLFLIFFSGCMTCYYSKRGGIQW